MNISYQVIRSNRKTIALQITPEGQLLVRSPRAMSDARIREFVQSKSSWIQKHMQTRPQLPKLSEAQLRIIGEEAAKRIPARVAYFAPLLGVACNRITIRTQRTRWGSCSSKGNLNFNRLLVLAPAAVLDYVVVHELCHLREMNHSPQFWSLVESILPDYKQRKKWLKENGNTLLSQLP